MNRHQPPHASASLQVNPSAAIMSGYPPPAQPDPPQAQSSSFGRASLSHASTATGINMPAAQTDTADSSMGRQAAQAQASSSGSLQSLQGDSPKTRWSAVAANQEQPSGRPRGFSPQEHGDPSASGEGHLPSHPVPSTTLPLHCC